MEVSPKITVSSSEWFLFAPSSGVRDNGPAANRLCTWLANKLRVLIRSVTHATSLLKLHNLSTHLDESCPDIALYVPGSSTWKESAVTAQSDPDDDDFQEYLAYSSRVLGCGAQLAVPVDHAPPSAFPALLEATSDFTVVTCTRSSPTTLHSLCTTTEDELEYLKYREKFLN